MIICGKTFCLRIFFYPLIILHSIGGKPGRFQKGDRDHQRDMDEIEGSYIRKTIIIYTDPHKKPLYKNPGLFFDRIVWNLTPCPDEMGKLPKCRGINQAHNLNFQETERCVHNQRLTEASLYFLLD